jgi:hypothetical protein
MPDAEAKDRGFNKVGCVKPTLREASYGMASLKATP